MRPGRSPDPSWHHPLERVWCISIRSWLLLRSSQLRIRRLRAQFYSYDQNGRHERYHDQRYKIVGGTLPRSGVEPSRQFYAEDLQDAYEVPRPSLRHRGSPEGELQDKVPPDQPSYELPQRSIGEGVGAASYRYGRGELRVAEGRKGAHYAADDVRECHRRSSVAGSYLSGEDKESCSDDHSDTEEGEVQGSQRLAQLELRLLGVPDRLFYGFGAHYPH